MWEEGIRIYCTLGVPNNFPESSKREAKKCFEDSNRIYIYVKYVY